MDHHWCGEAIREGQAIILMILTDLYSNRTLCRLSKCPRSGFSLYLNRPGNGFNTRPHQDKVARTAFLRKSDSIARRKCLDGNTLCIKSVLGSTPRRQQKNKAHHAVLVNDKAIMEVSCSFAYLLILIIGPDCGSWSDLVSSDSRMQSNSATVWTLRYRHRWTAISSRRNGRGKESSPCFEFGKFL